MGNYAHVFSLQLPFIKLTSTREITAELPSPDASVLLPRTAGTEPPLPAKCSVATQTPEPPLPTPTAMQPPFAAPSVEATPVVPPRPARYKDTHCQESQSKPYFNI